MSELLLVPLNGKVPVVKDWTNPANLKTREQWRANGHAGWQEFGIVTGASNGIVVADFDTKSPEDITDSPEARDLYEALLSGNYPTVAQETPRGWHFFFRYVPGIRNARPSKYLDIRGEGGQVKVHDSTLLGRLDPETLPEPPAWLAERSTAPQAGSVSPEAHEAPTAPSEALAEALRTRSGMKDTELWALLNHVDTNDRSGKVYYLSALCAENGFTLADTVALVSSSANYKSKYGNRDRTGRDEIAKAYTKAKNEQVLRDSQLAGLFENVPLWQERAWLTQCYELAVRGKGRFEYLIGQVLAHVGYQLPWQVKGLTYSTTAALNINVTLVGPPGAGKSSSIKQFHSGFEIVGARPVVYSNAGSGEGLHALFKVIDSDNEERWLNPDRAAFVFNSELGSLTAAQSRPGSGLMFERNKALTGDPMGRTLTRATINIPAEQYRYVEVLGVQPGTAWPLINPEARSSGQTDRLLWFSSFSGDIPKYQGNEWTIPKHIIILPDYRAAVVPEPSKSLSDDLSLSLGDDDEPEVVEPEWEFHYRATPAIDRVFREHHEHIGTLDVDDMNYSSAQSAGHVARYQFILACYLAAIEGRLEIIDDDWRVAGRIIDEISRVNLAKVERVTRNQDVEQAKARGRLDAVRSMAASEVEQDVNLKALVKRIRTLIDKQESENMPLTRSYVRSNLNSKTQKPRLDEALALMIEAEDNYSDKAQALLPKR